ncbi:hypothetical protein NPS70_11855 [Streptomyces sp. C10-9-1]|uniref:hypothetical protein n=1 Tax=Streptomyces sp. C10-9-1 TaxID=1859285 RepID=UPI0021123F5D|nr:hypothetical protein [Streptomyces sp. C10-9-1]
MPEQSTGCDAAEEVPGRKRGLAVDVLRLAIAVVALAAGIALLDKVAADTDTRSESQAYRAMTAVILRRLTGATAATWRSTWPAGS